MKPKPISLEINKVSKKAIYAGFWARCNAATWDLLITYTILTILYLAIGKYFKYSKNFYYFLYIFYFLYDYWLNIYLVQRYGGTPGKLITGIKILKLDGSKITWKEATLRHLVHSSWVLFITICPLISLAEVSNEYFNSLPYKAKLDYCDSCTKRTIYKAIFPYWFFIDVIMLLFNKRKRALHDFIAGTVVVKTDYLETRKQRLRSEHFSCNYHE